jgi:hypothetical protein
LLTSDQSNLLLDCIFFPSDGGECAVASQIWHCHQPTHRTQQQVMLDWQCLAQPRTSLLLLLLLLLSCYH